MLLGPSKWVVKKVRTAEAGLSRVTQRLVVYFIISLFIKHNQKTIERYVMIDLYTRVIQHGWVV